MSQAMSTPRIPFRAGTVRGPMTAAALVICATLALTIWSPFGTKPRETLNPVAERQLLFADRADGAVVVTDARTGGQVAVVAPGEGGFVRGALRGLARTRLTAGVGREQPFRLAGWADGRLTLEDPTTGAKMELAAFGQTNAEVFLRFLSPTEDQR